MKEHIHLKDTITTQETTTTTTLILTASFQEKLGKRLQTSIKDAFVQTAPNNLGY